MNNSLFKDTQISSCYYCTKLAQSQHFWFNSCIIMLWVTFNKNVVTLHFTFSWTRTWARSGAGRWWWSSSQRKSCSGSAGIEAGWPPGIPRSRRPPPSEPATPSAHPQLRSPEIYLTFYYNVELLRFKQACVEF